jgi:DNA-binding CsgD family transcriptional regulator
MTDGRTDRAAAEFGEVVQGLRSLGARNDAYRVARRLRSLGTHQRRPGAGRPSYGDELSPREKDVVRLVAAGRSDREIARLLFLSPRTVASHVTSARRKLRAPSRTALAVQAVTRGITDTPGPSVD